MAVLSRNVQRVKRHARVRRRVIGTAERPRLQIHRTLHHIYAAVIDDTRGHTLVAASTRGKDLAALDSRTNLAAARKVGEEIGKKAKAAGIKHFWGPAPQRRRGGAERQAPRNVGCSLK